MMKIILPGRSKCHCRLCLPCMKLCCDNPVVRSGKCCDPTTLGFCLQPFEPQCFAPCCHLSVKLHDNYRWVNGELKEYVGVKLINPLKELYPIDVDENWMETSIGATASNKVAESPMDPIIKEDIWPSRKSSMARPRRLALSENLRRQGRKMTGSRKLTVLKGLPYYRRQLISPTDMITDLGKSYLPKKTDVCFSVNV